MLNVAFLLSRHQSYMKINQNEFLMAKSPSEETAFLMGQTHLRQDVFGRF